MYWCILRDKRLRFRYRESKNKLNSEEKSHESFTHRISETE